MTNIKLTAADRDFIRAYCVWCYERAFFPTVSQFSEFMFAGEVDDDCFDEITDLFSTCWQELDEDDWRE